MSAQNRPAAPPALIALDWGTSSLRAWLLDATGEVLDSHAEASGIMQVADGDFGHVYRQLVAPWRPAHSRIAAIACGMIGSSGGWQEAPYVDCPADLNALADNLSLIQTGSVPLYIVPGVMQRSGIGDGVARLPNVMRGEETQGLGALALDARLAEESLLVLPGTHCKWVEVRDRRLAVFSTYMTGELFAVLRDHSILGKPARDVASHADDAAFVAGLDAAREAGSAGVSGALFSARSRVLTGDLAAEHSLDYLSGLLIGEELRSVLAQRGQLPALRLIGDSALCARYARALEHFGVADIEQIEDAAVAGLWQIATAAGLV